MPDPLFLTDDELAAKLFADHERRRKFLYLMAGDDPVRSVKIGVSIKPKQRRNGLQTASSGKLRILGTWELPSAYEVEARLKALLRPVRLQGEWFALREATARFIIEESLEGRLDSFVDRALRMEKLALSCDAEVRLRGWTRLALAEANECNAIRFELQAEDEARYFRLDPETQKERWD